MLDQKFAFWNKKCVKICIIRDVRCCLDSNLVQRIHTVHCDPVSTNSIVWIGCTMFESFLNYNSSCLVKTQEHDTSCIITHW